MDEFVLNVFCYWKCCFIKYNNSIENKNLTIPRLDNNTVCIDNIASGNYDISIYDYETEDEIYTLTPAYQTMTAITRQSPMTNTFTSTQCEQPKSQKECIKITIPTDQQTNNNYNYHTCIIVYRYCLHVYR